jgi:hypothetical protein
VRERCETRNTGLDGMLDCPPKAIGSSAVLDVSRFPKFRRSIHVDMDKRGPERLDHESMIFRESEPIDSEILVGWQVQNEALGQPTLSRLTIHPFPQFLESLPARRYPIFP